MSPEDLRFLSSVVLGCIALMLLWRRCVLDLVHVVKLGIYLLFLYYFVVHTIKNNKGKTFLGFGPWIIYAIVLFFL